MHVFKSTKVKTMKNILIVVTNCNITPKNKPTGIWLEEYTIPYQLFTQAGFKIETTSIKGGAAPIDPRSNPTDEQSKQWAEAIQSLQSTTKLSTVNLNNYDAVFFPGGHGTMFDLPNNADINNTLQNFQENNKVIAAVCHGPACFVGATLKNGKSFLNERSVTGFTNEEEIAAEQEKNMPFLLEDELFKNGAIFIKKSEWSDHVEVDGNLITGQNPQSSKSIAEAIIKKLNN
ncbi:MAG: type 1 glutamine amidotransferase domain-containing protein [Gammaproteobacteria bacterium]|nr:type 1 glutamine amidotransferase domain-containing protein [Gammaproteobacteria bacterium]